MFKMNPTHHNLFGGGGGVGSAVLKLSRGGGTSAFYSVKLCIPLLYRSNCSRFLWEYLLFPNWVQEPYQEIQAQGFSYSPSLRGLFGKPRACISWYGTSTQLVNSLLHDPF